MDTYTLYNYSAFQQMTFDRNLTRFAGFDKSFRTYANALINFFFERFFVRSFVLSYRTGRRSTMRLPILMRVGEIISFSGKVGRLVGRYEDVEINARFDRNCWIATRRKIRRR